MRGASACVALGLVAACGSRAPLPGHPAVDSEVVRPSQVLDFSVLYANNCAGCHGPQGMGSASVELGNPVYLAFADDGVLRRVTAGGVAGTAMPAFAEGAGGTLTDAQVEALVQGIRARWGRTDVLLGAEPPPYAADGGDSGRGAQAYAVYCAACHGPDGRGGARGSSIVDGTYLALVSEQHLRTTVLVGRPDLGAPDWRSDVAGRPMTAADVSDVVAWLSSQRPRYPGQPYPGGRAAEGEGR